MRHWHLLLIVCWIPLMIAAKSEVDSLKIVLSKTDNDSIKAKLLMHMWEATAYTEPDEARKYADSALDISKKAGYKRGMADAWQRIASGYSVKSLNDSALYYYNKALAVYSQLNDVRMEGVIINNIAMTLYSEGKYVEAMLKTEEGLKKSSEANDTPGIAVSLQLLGNIHHFLSNYEEAQKYLIQAQNEIAKIYKGVRYADGLVYLASNYMAQEKYRKALDNLSEAIRIYEKEGDRFFLAQALNNSGYIHYKLENYDTALVFFNNAVELSEEQENNQMLILATNNLGLIHKAENLYNKAKTYFENALSLARKINDKQRIAMISRNLGDLYTQHRQYGKAMSFYDTAVTVGKETRSKSSLKESYKSIADALAEMGDFEQSLTFYKLHVAMSDSIFDERKTRQMEEMEARYQKEKQEKEIAVQKSQIEILSKDLVLKNIKQNVLIGGLILSLLLGIYFVFHLKNKMKRNRLIREQEKLLGEEQLKNAELQRDNYEKELEIKKNELTSRALHIVQKNELLQNLKNQITELEEKSERNDRTGYRQLKFMINGSAQTDREWENFNRHFEEVHQGFLTRLKNDFPILTSNDLRLSAMMKLNLSSKEVAAIMNISPESVKKARYRLRKKLELPEETDLHAFMMNMEK